MNYKNYSITTGGLGYLYVHEDYEGCTFLGEDIESRDPRCGSAKTIEECKSEIDEIELDREEREQMKQDDARLKTPPQWWLDNYTDASGNCFSDADSGL